MPGKLEGREPPLSLVSYVEPSFAHLHFDITSLDYFEGVKRNSPVRHTVTFTVRLLWRVKFTLSRSYHLSDHVKNLLCSLYQWVVPHLRDGWVLSYRHWEAWDFRGILPGMIDIISNFWLSLRQMNSLEACLPVLIFLPLPSSSSFFPNLTHGFHLFLDLILLFPL